MKSESVKVFIISSLIVMVSQVFAQIPDTSWTKTFGGNQYEFGYSVKQTSDKGYIIAGFTDSYGAGQRDVYVVKTDTAGNTLWTRTLGGSGYDEGYSVQILRNREYIIAGYTTSYGAGHADVYLIKLDDAGNTLWTKTYGGGENEYGYSVKQTSDGGYIIVGNTESYGAGGTDVYLIKTDSSGDTLWTRTIGGSKDDYSRSVQQTQDGGYIIAGFTTSYGAGFFDVYFIKTDSSGNVSWAKTFGGTGADLAYSVQQTSDGGYIVVGGSDSYGAGEDDILIIRTDNGGNRLWMRTFGTMYNDVGHSIQQTQDGGYIIAGYTEDWGVLGPGDKDVYVVKLDSTGRNTLCTRTLGGTDEDVAYSVQQTQDGDYIVTGYTFSYGAGSSDLWLIKLGNEESGIELTETSHKVSVSPNPFTSSTTLYAGHNAENLDITIYDVNGRTVKQIFSHSGVITFGNDLNPGIYFLKIGEINGRESLLKIIKTR